MSVIYTKRPLRVEAFQYLGNLPNTWPRWARKICITNRREFDSIKSQDPRSSVLFPMRDNQNRRGAEFLLVCSWAGGSKREFQAHDGDYVVREPNGVIRVYAESVFKSVHEPLPLADTDTGIVETPDCVDFYGDHVGYLSEVVEASPEEQMHPVEEVVDIQKPDDPGAVQEPDPELPDSNDEI